MPKVQAQPDNTNSQFLQGALFDSNSMWYREIWETYTKDKDKEKFCNAVFANIYIFTPAGQQTYTNIISEFKEKTNHSTFDDRAMELAEYLHDAYRFSLENQFHVTESKYLENVREEIKKYSHSERAPKFFHRTFQTILILFATSLPFILTFNDLPKFIPITISIIVALVAALSNHFKFGGRAIQFRQAAENMQLELSLYQSGRRHYKDLQRGAAFNLFMDNIDELRHKRNEFSLELEQTAQVLDKKITELLNVPTK